MSTTKKKVEKKSDNKNTTLSKSPMAEEKLKFFKIGINILLNNDFDISVVEAPAPRIIDNVTAYLRELKLRELAGSANFDRKRENLQLWIRAAVAPIQVSDVLFHSALIQ